MTAESGEREAELSKESIATWWSSHAAKQTFECGPAFSEKNVPATSLEAGGTKKGQDEDKATAAAAEAACL